MRSVVQNGPEPSSARQLARQSEPLTAPGRSERMGGSDALSGDGVRLSVESEILRVANAVGGLQMASRGGNRSLERSDLKQQRRRAAGYCRRQANLQIVKKRQRQSSLAWILRLHRHVAQKARHVFHGPYPVTQGPAPPWNGSALPPLFTVGWVHQRTSWLNFPAPIGRHFCSNLAPTRLCARRQRVSIASDQQFNESKADARSRAKG